MVRKLSFATSRNCGVRLFRWSALALAGVVGGVILGELAAGTRLGGGTGAPESYGQFSANPDALVAQGSGARPCLDCADSHGDAARLQAGRGERISAAELMP